MKVKPIMDYVLLGTNEKLDKNKVYDAEIAWNQPGYKKNGLIFVNGVLLVKGEYKIIRGKK